jgi:hypothetical protein
MAYGESVGTLAVVGIGIEQTPGVAVSPSFYMLFNSETMGNAIEVFDDNGIAGTRGHAAIRRVNTTQKPGGGLVREGISREHLPVFLQLALGAWSGGSTTLGSGTLKETLPSCTIRVFKNVKEFVYAGCKIGSLKLSSSATSQPLKCELSNIVAMTETIVDRTMGAPVYPATQRPLVHRDLVMTIDNVATQPEDVEIEIVNGLDEGVFRNSITRLSIPEIDRRVSGKVTLPWNADTYANQLAKFYSGAAASLSASWADASLNTVKALLGNIFFTGETPKVPGRTIMTLGLPFDARDSVDGANDSIQIILA